VQTLTSSTIFEPSRWLKENEDLLSPAVKTAFCAFGAGAFTCLGINLAYMQMRYAALFFFRECRGARLVATATAESMEMENYFLVTPKGHKYESTSKK
jgi:cytochrome P450